jgi:hypothetical protein
MHQRKVQFILMKTTLRISLFTTASAAACIIAAGCSGSNGASTFPGAQGGGGSSGGGSSNGGNNMTASSGGGGSDDGGSFLALPDSCSGLVCMQVDCEGGTPTTISGTVYDPAGKVPLYNVIVYVPSAPVQPFTTSGATCSPCGGTVSGSPVAATLTDATGHFSLTNIPPGKDIPLVMQVGRWRRQVTIPSVTACAETVISDHNLTRLPRNQSEGDLPRVALATGGADPLECLLRKVGVDDSEFTPAGGSGRVHLYSGGSWTDAMNTTHTATSGFASSLNGGAQLASATTIWNSAPSMMAYDMILLACEGTLNEASKPVTARQALYDFENAGGRVFASHWHRYWLSDGPAPVPSVGTWLDQMDPAPTGATAIGNVDVSFPKGQALRDWLVNVGASTTPGQLPIKDSKDNISAVNLAEAQQWITMPNPNVSNQTAVEYMTFNAPIGVPAASQCGRVVYSDLHVSSGDQPGQPFPSGCITTDLSPQEKALEFMLFDLSSCIQTDGKAPTPPVF